ncbi:MAG: DsrE family protein [Anaerolineales bacterium]
MDKNTVILFTRNGMGEAPGELQTALAVKFLTLLDENRQLPGKIVFYTDGVKLICHGSPAIDILKKIESQGVELVICHTCLNFFGLLDQVAVGVVGGMGDIIEALRMAKKVISV